MDQDILITFNAGSSSLKIGVFRVEGKAAQSLGRLKLDFLKSPLLLDGSLGDRHFEEEIGESGQEFDREAQEVLAHIEGVVSGRVSVAAHRIVHGGAIFAGPARLDDRAISQIEALIPLAPLHQPSALRVVKALGRHRADILQTASFDTAFHSTQEDAVRRMAIPRAMHDNGIRRYGFHGISYKSVLGKLASFDRKVAAGKIIAAHLGSGASVCALSEGLSRDTSMGFSVLDGIPMSTRPGWLDPGVLLHMLRNDQADADRLEQFLYHECGLLGISGISGDMRKLAGDPSTQAQEAVEHFCLRVAGEISRQAATIGGVDTLVFTAGIGENHPEVRHRIASHLTWLGVELNESANARSELRISTPESPVAALVVATDEEQTIADEAMSLLVAKQSQGEDHE